MRSVSVLTTLGLVGGDAAAASKGDTGASMLAPAFLCGTGDAISNEMSISLELEACGSGRGDGVRSGGKS